MNDNTRALPDRTRAIISVDVIVPKVGRRVRMLGTVSQVIEGGERVFHFRPKKGDEIWRFLPSNPIACHAITVDQFSKGLRDHGEVEALWDEIEGHPVIMISLAPLSENSPLSAPLLVAKRVTVAAKPTAKPLRQK